MQNSTVTQSKAIGDLPNEDQPVTTLSIDIMLSPSNPQDALCSIPLDQHINGDQCQESLAKNPSKNADELVKMEQGQSHLPELPLPHHLRPNCKAIPGRSSLRPSRYSRNSDLQPLSSASADSNLSVCFFDEIDEIVQCAEPCPEDEQAAFENDDESSENDVVFTIRWPSVVTETRIRPRTLAEEKSLLFYTEDEMALFKQEFRAQIRQQLRAQSKKFVQPSLEDGASSGSIVSLGGIWSSVSSVLGTVRSVAKEVALVVSEPADNSSNLQLVDTMYLF